MPLAVTGYLAVFLGAGIGGALRHAVNLLAARLLGTGFSTFSLDAAVLQERGQTGTAVLYVALSLAAGIGALFAGLVLVRTLFRGEA